jgi:L-xylulokinase
LLADVVNLDLEVTDTAEAGARGAAALAGMGIGWYTTLLEAANATVRVTRRHRPRPIAELQDRYQRYVKLVEALADDAIRTRDG